jgi:hypothetical protein
MEVKYLNLDLNLLWKDLGMKLGEIIKNYKTLLSQNSKRKRYVLWELWVLKSLCQIWFFGHISFDWAFLDLQLWDLIDHKRPYMWEKFHVIWICIQRDPSI